MKKNRGRIIFRADADTQMGFGHFVRCGALAEILSDEWVCILYTRCKINSLISESGKHYHEIVQLPDNVDFFSEAEKPALFLFGYLALLFTGPGKISMDKLIGK